MSRRHGHLVFKPGPRTIRNQPFSFHHEGSERPGKETLTPAPHGHDPIPSHLHQHSGSGRPGSHMLRPVRELRAPDPTPPDWAHNIALLIANDIYPAGLVELIRTFSHKLIQGVQRGDRHIRQREAWHRAYSHSSKGLACRHQYVAALVA